MILHRKAADSTSYFGIYRAKVVDNKDPQHIGRVKVIVPSLADESTVLWARPVSVFGYKPTHGSHVVPDVGCFVYVMFEDGDIRFPVYVGGVVLENHAMSESTQDGSSENEHVIFRTKNGSYIKISDNKNKITLKSPAGRKVEINDSGNKITIATNSCSIELLDDSGTVRVTSAKLLEVRTKAIRIIATGGVGGRPVSIQGDIQVEGSIYATGSIIDSGGNTNHHSH